MRALRVWTLLGVCSVFAAAACGDSGSGGAGGGGSSTDGGSDPGGGGFGNGGNPTAGGGGSGNGGSGNGGSGGVMNNCGDGSIDIGEQCDTTDLNDETCTTLGLGEGELGCNLDCTFDDTDCENQTECGDGNIGAGETCDDGNGTSGDGCSDMCQIEGSACVATGIPGTADADISMCVCGLDDFCCTNAWDVTCVQIAIDDCNVNCGDPCAAHAGPGSNDAQLTSCVCEAIPACCTGAWNDACVTSAIDDCGACVVAVCGDSDVEGTEQCDDGNVVGGDGCSAMCVIEVAACGNGILEGNEECDDGNVTSNDGCTALCQFEGLACVPHATAGVADEAVEQCVCAIDSFCCTNAWDEICVGVVVDDCAINCGDPCSPHPGPGSNDAGATNCVCGVVPGCCTGAWTATCVAAATNDCGTCEPAVCGDGSTDFPEQCDDGNNSNGDGCSATCLIENAVCGNAIIESGEECDDDNTTSGDGCSATCQFEGFACVPHDTPGIANEAIETCVCNLDPFCCETAWDFLCVNEANAAPCNAGCGDECTVHATPGSDNPAITECVCAQDAFCCTNSWDQICLDEAVDDCGACGGNICGNGALQAPAEECDDGNLVDGDGCDATCQYEGSVCVPRSTPGADNDAVVACTCGIDPLCCGTVEGWDEFCVNTANSQCAAGCGSPCTPHAGVGSSNGFVTQCVCFGAGADPFCCDTAWDAICVGEADTDCNANCP